MGRISIGAMALGLAQAALDQSAKYSLEREQFGKPIGQFQAIAFMLADMATEVEAARLLVYQAAMLKDLKQPECINQVVAPDLPADFPPLPTVGLQTKNLPEQATPFVGRQFELAQIERLLGAQRLITLFGPGGIGKTRLALAVAEALGNHYQQGAYFVPLLSIDSSTAFVPAVANACGARERGLRRGPQALSASLRAARRVTSVAVADQADPTLGCEERHDASIRDPTTWATG